MLRNIFIQTVKAVDTAVIETEVLEYQQWIKVHKILFKRYLGKRKMELLKREIKLIPGV